MVNGTAMQRSGVNSDYHILFGRVRSRSGACSGAFGHVRVRSGAFGRLLVGPSYSNMVHVLFVLFLNKYISFNAI